MNNWIKELEELDKKHFIHPTSPIKQQQQAGPSFIFTKGEGVYLEDLKGNRVIDGMSSLWNVNIGHGREEMGEVAKEQMSKLAYSSCFATFSNEPAIRLAAKLAEVAPGNLSATFFTSGGSEANDTAYKLARHYWILKGKPNKQKIITRTKSYHGVALGGTSATGLQPFREFTNSIAPDFDYVDHFSSEALRRKIEEEGPEKIAAFVAEPVQGAGGVHIAPEEYFKEVRVICDQYDILFITDEVITGFGRTGTYFGIEHYGVVPDMMCFAKGVTSGYAQLGGVMMSDQMYEEFKELSTGTLLHGYTYSGHAMACSVALKNLEIIEKEQLITRAKEMGGEMLAGFKELQRKHSIIGEVRALGLMGAIEIVKDQNSKERYQTALAPIIVTEAAKRGLVVRSVVFDSQDTLVIAPPLIINKKEIEEMMTILSNTFAEVELKMIG
ncbi:aminotransferase family protein [Halalkalibacter krulwichiae]|uniref:Taurine--pyruvate aminotransferase n=1 Tax=Halalkalibacter krulwichiae TaxID=199441 RepID=A0A1X9MCE8_9BACI|nr:aspartate aminotransferase family protein [Halalkalibacter krulwichiae]ARK29813.1 Taurine--pyruvate aminotransferase [Halalkalibacter krulwichiae]